MSWSDGFSPHPDDSPKRSAFKDQKVGQRFDPKVLKDMPAMCKAAESVVQKIDGKWVAVREKDLPASQPTVISTQRKSPAVPANSNPQNKQQDPIRKTGT